LAIGVEGCSGGKRIAGNDQARDLGGEALQGRGGGFAEEKFEEEVEGEGRAGAAGYTQAADDGDFAFLV